MYEKNKGAKYVNKSKEGNTSLKTSKLEYEEKRICFCDVCLKFDQTGRI
jgi:hypothetical protein